MEKKKLSLPAKILIGMTAGVVAGSLIHFFIPEMLLKGALLIRMLEIGGNLFLNMFRMIVVPVVLVSMIRGVASMRNPALLGRIGGKTLVLFAVTTVLSSTLAILASYAIGIGKGSPVTPATDASPKLEGSLQSIADTLASIVPANVFKSLVEVNMLQIIFVAVMIGIAVALLKDKLPILEKLLEELDMLNIKIVELTLAVAPYGVFCLLGNTFGLFGLSVLWVLGKYIFTIALVMAAVLALIYPLMLKFMAHFSPVAFYRKYASVMLLAFSTSSSNATLPSNIEVVTNQLKVPRHISTFVLTLGATINMNGTAIMQGCAAIFIAQLYGVNLSISQLMQIVVMCLIASVGTAGMPGAGVIMLGLVLQSVGLPLAGIALILGVDRIVDMMRTTLNITGDAITAVVVGASEAKHEAKE